MNTKNESLIPSFTVFHFFCKHVAQLLRNDVRPFTGGIFGRVVVAPVIIVFLRNLGPEKNERCKFACK